MSKFVGTEPSSYEKRIYEAVVSQRLRNTDLQEFIDFSINSVIILLPYIQLFLYFWIQT